VKYGEYFSTYRLVQVNNIYEVEYFRLYGKDTEEPHKKKKSLGYLLTFFTIGELRIINKTHFQIFYQKTGFFVLEQL